MPIIKDKYSAKGKDIRSKLITRIDKPATIKKNIYTDQSSTFQKQEIEAIQNRNISTNTFNRLDASGNLVTQSNISGFKLSNPNAFINIATINKGESLKDIIISHNNTTDTSTTFSLYWSIFPLSELNVVTSSGKISASRGGAIYRLLTDLFTSNSTLSLNSNNMFDSFNNINKTIYFYAVSSVAGIELTVLKC